LVTSPASVPIAPGSRVKTNRIDSIQLASGLMGGRLKGIRVPQGNYRELRHLCALRQTHLRNRSAYKCRIKGLLLHEGLKFPEAPFKSEWSKRVLNELRNLECSSAVRFRLDSLLDSLRHEHQQMLLARQRIKKLCQGDPQLSKHIGHLRSIPGIGPIVSSSILARVGDPAELGTFRQLAGFTGMTPREKSTGDRVNRGRITKCGDKVLRCLLI
jgi:transposase